MDTNTTISANFYYAQEKKSGEFFPIHIRVFKFTNKMEGVLDSIVRPLSELKNTESIPAYINEEVLECAPSPFLIAKELESFLDGCDYSEIEELNRFISKYGALRRK